MLGKELLLLLVGGRLLYCCFRSSILFFCICLRSFSTWVGSVVIPVWTEGPPKNELEILP